MLSLVVWVIVEEEKSIDEGKGFSVEGVRV